MIDDGPQFKLMLSRAVKRFELDLASWPRPPERGGQDWDSYWQCRFEDVLFRVGLGVRRLIEGAKLSIEVQARPIEVLHASLLSSRVPDAANYHRVDEFYDTPAATSIQLPLVKLCHAIVHSYVLVPQFEYTAMDGLCLASLFLASDQGRSGGVYVVEWRHFVECVVQPVLATTFVACFLSEPGKAMRFESHCQAQASTRKIGNVLSICTRTSLLSTQRTWRSSIKSD